MAQNNLPSWYWPKGLHDAQIKNLRYVELEYDYRSRNPVRNYIQIDLDSHGALFDNTIVSIKFFNCKNIFSNNNVVGFWWKSDELKKVNNKYQLELVLSHGRDEFSFNLNFDFAETERKT